MLDFIEESLLKINKSIEKVRLNQKKHTKSLINKGFIIFFIKKYNNKIKYLKSKEIKK